MLADAPQFRGGSWGDDDTILFNRGRTGLYRVAAKGGEIQEVTKPDLTRRDHDHRWPQHLPGGRAALFDILAETYEHSVAVVDLATGQTRILVENAGSPRWSPTGHLLFGRQGLLYAAPFDLQALTISGPPVQAIEGVAMWGSPGGSLNAGGNVYPISGTESARQIFFASRFAISVCLGTASTWPVAGLHQSEWLAPSRFR